MRHTYLRASGHPPCLRRAARLLRRTLLLLTACLAAQTAAAYTRNYQQYDERGFNVTWRLDTEAKTALLKSVSYNSSGWGHYVMPEQVAYYGGDEMYAVVGFTDDFESYADSLTIANTVKAFGTNTFRAKELSYIDVGDGVEELPDSAFYGCQELTHVRIGTGVKRIGRYALHYRIGGAYSTLIKTIEMGENVEEIDEGAFMGCRLIKTIHIPAATRSIHPYAFRYMEGLERIEVDEANAHYRSIDGILYDKAVTTLVRMPGQMGTLSLPATVTTIGDDAISENYALTEFRVPDHVTRIGNDAFEWAHALTSLHTGEGVTTIGDRAFYSCKNLKTVHIGDAVETVGAQLFYDKFPTELYLGASLRSLGNSYIGHGFTLSPDNRHFRMEGGLLCDAATTTVYASRDDATEMTVPEGIQTIAPHALSQLSATAVTLPASLTTIGDSAFYYCHKLTAITVPAGVKTVGNSAFDWCYKLAEVYLPEGLRSLGARAFAYSSELRVLTLPSSLQFLGDEVCAGCPLDSFTFLGNADLLTADVLRGTRWPGVVTFTAKRIPSGVFNGRTDLYTLYLGEGTERIDDKAFSNCTYLQHIYWTPTLRSIGAEAFSGCNLILLRAILPEGVTSIDASAFSDCSKLYTVSLPATLQTLGNYAFGSCNSLRSVRVNWAEPIEFPTYAFGYIRVLRRMTLYVPAGRRAAYAEAEGWKDFGRIIEVEGTYFRRVTAADDVTDGGIYYLVDEANARAAYANGAALAADAVTLDEGEIFDLTGGRATEVVLEAVKGQADAYSVRLGGQYLSLTSDGLSLTDEPQAWTVNPAAASPLMQGDAAVAFSKEGTIEGTTEAIDADTRFAPTLYRKVGNLTVNKPEGYSTFVSALPYVMPEGLEGAIVEGTKADSLLLDFRYKAGSTVPALVPLLLKGAQGTHTYAVTTLPGGMPEVNLLAGVVVPELRYIEDYYGHYNLRYDEADANLGFYAFSEDDAALTDGRGYSCHLLEPGKAYLRLEGWPTHDYSVYLLEKAGITAITAPLAPNTDGPAVIYDLSGRRIAATSAASLPPGIYIVNGKKTLVR